MSRLFVATLLIALLSPRLSPALELGQLFSVETRPGRGTLIYRQGAKSEKVELGAAAGHYGMGVVFRGSLLPTPYSQDYGNARILQIALGTLKANLQAQVPQFGSLTLIMKEIPKQRTVLKLLIPSGKDASLKELGLLLFTSPSTPSEQGDEDKLKGTYFAQSGTIALTPLGSAEKLEVRSQGRIVGFKSQTVRLEIDALLATPFTTQETTLKGSIELPLYWPVGKEAKAMTRRIAADSLGTAPALPGPEGLTTHKREIAGSNKKDASSARSSARPAAPSDEAQ